MPPTLNPDPSSKSGATAENAVSDSGSVVGDPAANDPLPAQVESGSSSTPAADSGSDTQGVPGSADAVTSESASNSNALDASGVASNSADSAGAPGEYNLLIWCSK